jgi:hypothetical protein
MPCALFDTALMELAPGFSKPPDKKRSTMRT